MTLACTAPEVRPLPPATALLAELTRRVDAGSLELPVLPEVAQQVMALTASEGDSRALAEVLRRDPAFAAHLLRLANSPVYAPRVPIVSLQQAVSRMGMTTIRAMAVVISCKTRAFHVDGRAEDIRALFRHSLAAGLYGQEIARMRRTNVEDGFLSGLLHDVGRPALMQASIDAVRELRLPPVPAHVVDGVVDLLHEQVAQKMIEQWSLPSRLGAAIRHHHHPENAGEALPGAALVCLADALSHCALSQLVSVSVTEDDVRTHPMAAVLNLYPEDVDKLLARRSEILAQAESLV